MSISIRKATMDDAELLVRCNREMAIETEDKELPSDTVLAGVRAALDDPNKGFYLVAESDGAPAGGLLVTSEWSDWNNAYYWWIQSVYVFPEARGRGAYTSLHREVEQLARAAGNVCSLRLYVDKGNTRAKAVYEALGMHPGRYDFYEVDFRPTL